MDKQLLELLENLKINLETTLRGIEKALQQDVKPEVKQDGCLILTLEKFKKCLPNLKIFEYKDVYTEFMKGFQHYSFFENSKRLTFFLAQIAHESAGLLYWEELASGRAYEGRKDLGNIQQGDGVRYKGRSPIQLTGRSNYESFFESIGLPRQSSPLLLSANFDIGIKACFWFWEKNKLHRFADANDFKGLTKAINGGLTHLSDREKHLERITNIIF